VFAVLVFVLGFPPPVFPTNVLTVPLPLLGRADEVIE